MKLDVFNVEFDGIDKCGKDTIWRTMISYHQNRYIYDARGILSQLAYAKLFNRDYEYKYTEGYFENTLVVYLTVDKDDWEIRCDISRRACC
jgi:hypothetical protein